MSALLLTKIVTAQLDDQTLQLCERTQEHEKLPYFAVPEELVPDFEKVPESTTSGYDRRRKSKAIHEARKPESTRSDSYQPSAMSRVQRGTSPLRVPYVKWIPAQRNAKAKELNM